MLGIFKIANDHFSFDLFSIYAYKSSTLFLDFNLRIVMKNTSRLLFSLLFTATGFSMGTKTPDGLSLLLVPARPAMVQLGMDMAAREHALLMTYAPETAPDQLFLHIWDGAKWLRVPQSSFESGTFVKNKTSRLLVVGEENQLTATLIEKALGWSPEVLHLGSENITDLINQMGRLYEFDRRDWQWISQRYDLQLEDLNQGRVQSSWYVENKASELAPSEKPWKKHEQEVNSTPPETSLTPLMPPVNITEVEVVEVQEVEVQEVETVEVIEGVPEESVPVDFSLEVE